MWVRKRLDVGFADLASACVNCLLPRAPAVQAARLERHWSAAGDALACLSVRSGFDLWLSAQNFPAGSEVLVSAITIPDMLRIIRDHGLVPVPVDIDVEHLAIDPASLERAVSPRARALLVAHLFGTRQPLDDVIRFARQHKLLVVEDCAQAFVGTGFTGHPDAAVSMFSFGPIKTATALGGGLLVVRQPELLPAMRSLLAAEPLQTRGAYLRRVVKYSAMKLLSTRLLYAAVLRAWQALGGDPDQLVNGSVRGFAGPDFFRRIRRQPSAPLLSLIHRQIVHFQRQRLVERTGKGERLLEQLKSVVVCPGSDSDERSYWVFPVMVDDAERLIGALREAGFDGSSAHSMCIVPPPADRPALRAVTAETILPRIVYLPCYRGIPDHQIDRVAAVVRSIEESHEPIAEPATPDRRPLLIPGSRA
jgi:dTDP-4-amino-4,6-dideoxygalactose transaminase